tara:strand:+ start:397 stop:516 length:120 start_codon:yes stop_codon:yes gene_type:complete
MKRVLNEVESSKLKKVSVSDLKEQKRKREERQKKIKSDG